MNTSPSDLSRPVLSQASTLRLIYNATFALWLLLIAGATLSLTRLTLTESQLFLGGFQILSFTFLAGLLLLVLHFTIKNTHAA